MINLVKDTISRDDVDALIEWLKQDPIPRLTKGELTKQLECKWAEKLNTKHSVFVNSGSSAILLSLYSLMLTKNLRNKTVVVPGLSWITDISSVMQLGLNPILCDCNLNDLSFDLTHLENIFSSYKPAIVILVSVLGIVPNMDRITELCKKYNVIMLEDMCEAMNSSYQGKKLGTFGTVSTFSTYFGHAISSIEGGFSNTDDDELSTVMLACRNHGWDRDLPENKKKELKEKYSISDFNQMYTFYYPGFNLRSTDMQAFLGLRQMDKLERYTQKRFENFQLYRDKLADMNQLDITLRDGDFVSNLAFPVVSFNRKKITQELIKNKIEIRPLIAGNMAEQPFWTDRFHKAWLPNCNKIHDLGFYLPNHQDLTFDEIDFICNIINMNS